MAAPGGTGPIGPFPDGVDTDEEREAYDKLRRRVLWTLPYGLYVVGSRTGDRRNLMTLNWVTQLSFEPKLVGIGVEKTALTHELIEQGGAFSLCTVSRDDRAIVRKFTKPVEVDVAAGTMNGFPFHDGRSGAPILDQAPGYLDCRVPGRGSV
ncbi:MAG TPA: flavin reductase family protein, partial [Acidimicrobiales bacterium]|nr:flavin reductase family protein [Acidimicrobiales bacterium]